MDDDTCISALTNCGGFNEAFLPGELSEYGLLREYARAKEVMECLIEKYPEELHAQCALWGIWKME